MAKAPLARVGQAEDVEIEWQPFELRPEPAPLLDPSGDYVQRSWSQSVIPLSEQLGVEIRLPSALPRTRLAHEATEFARMNGKAEEMATALFNAVYRDGLDIGKIDTLVDVGAAVGLDPVALREALEDRTLQNEVEERLTLAKEVRITAVPSFLVGERYLLRGLVSEEDLKKAIQMVRDTI